MQRHATEYYLETQYNQSLLQLQCVLNLQHLPGSIPAHTLICKAVSMIKKQFNELNKHKKKLDALQVMPGPNIMRANGVRLYQRYNGRQSAIERSAFCPVINIQDNVNSDIPPLIWNKEDDIEYDQKQAQKLKSENQSVSMDECANGTNDFTNDWTDSFEMIEEDIDFDVPLEMPFESGFI